MIIFIGIDDTDNHDSRGTGYRARQLGILLSESGLADLKQVTRHQLLVDERIPYTSHNSSASLLLSQKADIVKIANFCRDFLLQESAEGADSGLCIAEKDKIIPEIITYGERAKKQIIEAEEAYFLAQKSNIYLEGLCGQKLGVIGSLAAVGLRAGGNDGRTLWLPLLRDLNGYYTVGQLKEMIKIDCCTDIYGYFCGDEEMIEIGDFCRPINKNNLITLLVEKQIVDGQYFWKTVSKDLIKKLTE